MRIQKISSSVIAIDLKRPFKTALRTVERIENVLVTVMLTDGRQGRGAAAPTAVITGETTASIRGAVSHFNEQLNGLEVQDFEQVQRRLHGCLVGNGSAKAAVDMALYDILGKELGVPVFTLLGGDRRPLLTDFTISLDGLDEMATETREKVEEGYQVLKIKVGGDPQLDLQRLQVVSEAAGPEIRLRLDANQGWTAKQAVWVCRELERRGYNIELLEQPVAARDYEGLRFVREEVAYPVFADESVFSPQDALRLVEMRAVDGLNIKLMKCGGIHQAVKIATIAETAGLSCMVGSMMESSLSVTAAAHLAASRRVITACDLDAPLFCRYNPAQGGITYNKDTVILPTDPGLGITGVQEGA